MALVVPAAFFSSLDQGVVSENAAVSSIVTDQLRGNFLKMARGTAIILLIVYVQLSIPY